jgi:hypothetical protein
LVIFGIVSCFMLEPAWTVILLIVLSCVLGMTGSCHCAQPSVETGLGWPAKVVLLLFAS